MEVGVRLITGGTFMQGLATVQIVNFVFVFLSFIGTRIYGVITGGEVSVRMVYQWLRSVGIQRMLGKVWISEI